MLIYASRWWSGEKGKLVAGGEGECLLLRRSRSRLLPLPREGGGKEDDCFLELKGGRMGRGRKLAAARSGSKKGEDPRAFRRYKKKKRRKEGSFRVRE